MDIRIGLGYDSHEFKSGVPLRIGRGGAVMEWREHGLRQSHFFAGAAGRAQGGRNETIRYLGRVRVAGCRRGE